MSYTKSRWSVECIREGDGSFHRLRISAGEGNEEKDIIAGCGCCGSPYGDNYADVVLIAAAQDLLEAIEGLVEAIDSADKDAALYRARAAIRKAKADD